MLHKYSRQELVTETTGDPGTAPTCGYNDYSEIQKLLCKDTVDKTRICTDWIGYKVIVLLVATVVKKGDCNHILLHFKKGNSGQRKSGYRISVTLA